MAQDRPQYTRLPGKRWYSFGTQTALWLGEDHVLQEARIGVNHLYHRFYLGDIHALIVRRSALGKAYNGILAGLLCVVGLIALAAGSLPPAVLAIDGVLAGLMLWNIYRGPTCVSHLQTSVHIRLLPSITRVKTAVALLEILQPIITQAQGGTSPEEVRRRAVQEAPTLSAAEPVLPPGPAGPDRAV